MDELAAPIAEAPNFKVQATPALRAALRAAIDVIEERRAAAYRRDNPATLRDAQFELEAINAQLLRALARNRNRKLPVIDAPAQAVERSS